LLFGDCAEFGRPTPDDAARDHRSCPGMTTIFPDLAGARIGRLERQRRVHARPAVRWCLDDVYYAGGYCGHGVAMATYLGEQIAADRG
jgi:glycine/D-amino acid oxidase-like deaminating enzyme